MTINLTPAKIVRAIELFLLLSIFILLLWSAPWQSGASEQRKVTVTGEASVEAEPDEYMFSPYFEVSGTDKDAVKARLTKQTNDAIEGLKKLGVEEKDMKLDLSSFDYWLPSDVKNTPLTASLQIKVRDKDLAQQVQNLLFELDIKGRLTPSVAFSEDKKKALDAEVVEKALQDAKMKAESQVATVGGKLGKVLQFSKSDSVFPIAYGTDMAVESRSGSAGRESAPDLLPGQNTYTQAVVVIYELK
jgi:uncharacterized protein YggE